MTPVVREWIRKAEADLATASRELRARKNPNYDAACFHAQQCAEKLLKGLLQHWAIAFPRTHDLSVLLDLCVGRKPGWELLRGDLIALSQYAIALRYPGESASRSDASHAVRDARNLLATLRPELGSL